MIGATEEPQTFVPVCASVICEGPGVIYVSIDPDVWKIRCRQCQEKAEHKCALKKLKNRFRGDPSKRRQPKNPDDDEEEGEGADGEGGRGGRGGKGGKGGKGGGSAAEKLRLKGKGLHSGGDGSEESMNLEPEEQLPDNVCTCKDRPKDVPPKPYVCLCELYKPLNFMLELEVTGEFKPAHVPKTKRGKEN